MRSELDWVARTLDFAARLANLRLAAGEDQPLDRLPAPLRKSLAGELETLAGDLRPLWLARSRPGGLEDSLHRFRAAPRLLVGARPAELFGLRGTPHGPFRPEGAGEAGSADRP